MNFRKRFCYIYEFKAWIDQFLTTAAILLPLLPPFIIAITLLLISILLLLYYGYYTTTIITITIKSDIFILLRDLNLFFIFSYTGTTYSGPQNIWWTWRRMENTMIKYSMKWDGVSNEKEECKLLWDI